MTTRHPQASLPLWALVAALALLAAPPLAAGDGDADPTFSGDGQTTFTVSPPAEYSERASTVVALGDGSLLIGGYSWDPLFAEGGFAVAKYTASGAPDLTFGSLGNRIVELGGDDALHRIYPEADGSLLLAGWSWISSDHHPALARLTGGGNLDGTFGTNGISVLEVPWESAWIGTFATAERRPAGSRRVFFYGLCASCPDPGTTRPFVVAVTPDGEADSTFGDDGWVVLPTLADRVGFDLDALGRPLVATRKADAPVSIWRLTANGDPDPTWGGGDGRIETLPVGSARLQLVAEPAGGRLYLHDGEAVHALLPSGALDESFGTGGTTCLDCWGDGGSGAERLAVQSDGKLVVVGWTLVDEARGDDFFLLRLGTDGLPDPAFQNGNARAVPFDVDPGGEDVALAVTFSGGKLVAVGYATDDDGGERWAILRTENALIFTDGFERGSTDAWTTPIAVPPVLW